MESGTSRKKIGTIGGHDVLDGRKLEKKTNKHVELKKKEKKELEIVIYYNIFVVQAWCHSSMCSLSLSGTKWISKQKIKN